MKKLFTSSLALAAALFSFNVYAKPISLAVFGDDLTDARQMPERFGFAGRLQNSLHEKGYDVTVHDYANDGDTTDKALSRLRGASDQDFDAVILAVSGADSLEGYSPAVTAANLQDIIAEVRRNNPYVPILITDVTLRGDEFNAAYGKEFRRMFKRISRRKDVSYYPDFAESVTSEARFLSPDGSRPNAAGYIEIVDRLLPITEDIIVSSKTAARR